MYYKIPCKVKHLRIDAVSNSLTRELKFNINLIHYFYFIFNISRSFIERDIYNYICFKTTILIKRSQICFLKKIAFSSNFRYQNCNINQQILHEKVHFQDISDIKTSIKKSFMITVHFFHIQQLHCQIEIFIFF